MTEPPKRVFKTRGFTKWARKLLPDKVLCVAAREIEQGIYEADLGHGLCKKRIAIPGQGKSGSTRTLVAKKHPVAVIFLVGRSKSDPKPDFDDSEVEGAKAVSDDLGKVAVEKLEELALGGALTEICNGKKSQ